MAGRGGGRSERRYWVWVARPDVYLDEDGADRRSLDPGQGYVPGAWWTCHRDTNEGDLVLLYRSGLRKDLAYLIEARSAAYSLLDDPFAAEYRWDYGCDYEVIKKFPKPLTLSQMKADPALGDWGALRANLQRRVYEIPADTWDHLLDRLAADRKALERTRQAARRQYSIERDIEDHLASDLGLLRPYGYNLEFRSRQHQWRRGGRADLVAYDRDSRRDVVIELKRGLVSRDAVAQLLSYRASMDEEFPAGRPGIGILIGDRLDNEAAGIVGHDERLAFVPLADLRPGKGSRQPVGSAVR